ncbi:DUF3152 domain-containing protein [Micromonospora sp. STR1_7]|uniref:DUF3152 domain-containing protein n=1 Tax=Micromonospora parastrephiae TaxID=2806101 RepID=A0ABS1XXN9_9ACTN|nr:DUF3152 domain-containing protein [Micromonospora parastrephiae]MBM0234020.1 DUF3152 domain-containing protein [Micromonospora parastrephiae]
MSSSARRQRRFALFAQLVAAVLAVGAAVTVIAEGPGGRPGAERLAADEIVTVPPLVAAPLPPSADPSPSASASSDAPPVLRLPGAVPSAGTGRFGYDDRSGPVLGRAGQLRRYRVAVESGSAEDAAEFGQVVGRALAGPGSWVDSGRLRLRQVPGGAPRDFTVYLATARTAGRMCADGGVDIRIGGRPYTSCRAPGQVIINLDRWRLSVPHYVSAGVPLSVYRMYVVNHEVGHQLGHRHERCPGAGRPAPVMMQQTLFLDGCRANPWPYLDGRRHVGPAL